MNKWASRTQRKIAVKREAGLQEESPQVPHWGQFMKSKSLADTTEEVNITITAKAGTLFTYKIIARFLYNCAVLLSGGGFEWAFVDHFKD